MNADPFEGKRKQFTGTAPENRSKLNDNDCETVAGKFAQPVGMIEQRSKIARSEIAKEEAHKRADDWARSLTDSDFE